MDSEFRRQFLSPKVIVLAVFVGPETEDTCVEDKTLVVPMGATLLATPVSSPDRGFERETLGPAESVTESPQDERVLSGHGDSAGNDVVGLVQLRCVGVPVSSLHTLLSENAWHHLVHHHSSFLQLSRARARVFVPGQSHLSWDRSLTSVAQDPAGTGGVGF